MQILHRFGDSIQRYSEELSDPDRYRPDHCPQCETHRLLRAHGFYTRTLVDIAFDGTIRVRRYLCRCCKRQVEPVAAVHRYPGGSKWLSVRNLYHQGHRTRTEDRARLGPKRALICDGSGLKPLPVIVTTSPGCAAIGAMRPIVGAAYKRQTHQRRISTVAQAETAGLGKGRRSNSTLSLSRQESPL